MITNNGRYHDIKDEILGVDADVSPPSYYRHYSNPSCQGTLIRATSKWTKKIPPEHSLNSAYVDRMWSWDSEKWARCIKHLPKTSLSSAIEQASEEALLAMAKEYFECDVIAVRWVYYYNVSTGYDCERIDFIYKPDGERQ